MTTCSAGFRQATAKIGDTLTADFSWENGVIDPVSHWVADMYILNPDHDDVIYTTSVQSSGTETLSYVADQPGIWYALIFAWNGENYEIFETEINVTNGNGNGNGNGDNTMIYIVGGVLVIATIAGILIMKHKH